MAKNMIIRKYIDKIEIRNEEGDLIVDIIIAGSSRTTSVNLSLKATKRTILMNKIPQDNSEQARKALYRVRSRNLKRLDGLIRSQ